MTFPTLNNIGGVISANQFNQKTNADFVAAVTKQNTTPATPTTSTTPITAINPDDRNAAAFGRQINANGTSTISTSSYYSGPTNPGGYAQSANNYTDTIVPTNNSSSSYYSGPTNPGGYAQSAVYSPGVSNQGNDIAFKTPAASSAGAATASGPRLDNPLSKLISYTYNLSLYMCTSEVYNNFVETGETSLEGMWAIAESGGTNRNGSGAKALFERDYYIDDLNFKTFVNTKSTDGPTVDSTSFEFKIFEPYGFKFLSELKNAAIKVSSQEKIPNGNIANHHMQQLYILGIKFYGYDSEGNPVKGGGTDQYSLFPRYFPLTLTNISFKLDGKATTYTIKAQNTAVQNAFGTKRGIIKSQLTLCGKTVEEILSTHPTDSLVAALNKHEEDLYTGGATKEKGADAKNTYQIKFIDNGSIKSSLLVDETDNEIKNIKANPSSNIKKTSESNDKNSQIATASFDRKNRTFGVTSGTTIAQAIDTIIGQSSYVREALNKQYKEDPEPEIDESAGGGEKKEFMWFTVTPIVKRTGYCTIRHGHVYDTTYLINNYKIPYLRSAFINKTSAYPGPHKRYNYIYTGLNNEILSYEQSYNALYYMSSLQQSPPNTSPPVEVSMMTKQNDSDAGAFGKAGQAAASIRTSLYSPGDKASARISILGDPDFLIVTTGMRYDLYPKRYGPDNSIDPHDGQVFVEIKFNEAIDYDNSTGLMTPSENIEVYKYPPELEKQLNGAISYMVVDVVSNFSRGRFTQDLNLILWSPPWPSSTNSSSATKSTNANASQPVNNTSSSYYSGPTNPGGYAQSVSYGEAQRSSSEANTPTTYQGKQPVGMPQVNTQRGPDIAGIISANQFNQRTNASIVGAITSPTNPKPNQTIDDDNSQSSKDMDWIKSRSYY